MKTWQSFLQAVVVADSPTQLAQSVVMWGSVVSFTGLFANTSCSRSEINLSEFRCLCNGFRLNAPNANSCPSMNKSLFSLTSKLG